MCSAAGRQHLLLAGELALAVGRQRRRGVGLAVCPRRARRVAAGAPVEDVVAGDVEHRQARLARRPRQQAGALGVDREGLLAVALGAVDVGPGGAVDQRVGRGARERRRDRVARR